MPVASQLHRKSVDCFRYGHFTQLANLAKDDVSSSATAIRINCLRGGDAGGNQQTHVIPYLI